MKLDKGGLMAIGVFWVLGLLLWLAPKVLDYGLLGILIILLHIAIYLSFHSENISNGDI